MGQAASGSWAESSTGTSGARRGATHGPGHHGARFTTTGRPKAPGRHRLTLAGRLSEWSLNAVGWLAAAIAEAGVREGIFSPLMLAVVQADG